MNRYDEPDDQQGVAAGSAIGDMPSFEPIRDHFAAGGTARLCVRPKRAQARLAPWQERRAKEVMAANLDGNLTLAALASACRLSSSHFSQAFRETVGCPPHQWLLRQRVERAKNLMTTTKLSLGEIALAAGFADQSHFTRVFSKHARVSPAAWRRARGAQFPFEREEGNGCLNADRAVFRTGARSDSQFLTGAP